MKKGGLIWNFVQEGNSSEKPNGQLECNVVKGSTGKLRVAKNGWRNRMEQPA
jgi:hypothetical protein